jgi:ATP-dependent RNA helicase DDX5/DBP2
MKAAKRAYREAKRALETLEHDKNRSAEITAAKETFKKLKAAYKALKRGGEHGTKRKRDESSSSSTTRKVKTFEDFSEFSCFKSEWTFAGLSEIQAASWPTVLKGQDAVCVAKTGSGKTLGFLLPVLFRITKDDRFSPTTKPPTTLPPSPLALVLAPTRELAIQIHNEAVRFGKGLGIRSVVVYGGAPRHNQVNSLKGGANGHPHLVTGTPGRLLDFIESRVLSLSFCTALVLDEADRMLDQGFKRELTSILANLPGNDDPLRRRQTLFYSATWPAHVQRVAKSFLKETHAHIALKSAGGNATDESTKLTVHENITQKVHVLASSGGKPALLRSILQKILNDEAKRKKEKIIVFLRRKRACDEVASEYAKMGYGGLCESLHGDKHQLDRLDIIAKFKASKVRLLFTTDVVARGIDIGDITLVVNYDFPLQRGKGGIEEYVHRVGRTGRAGRKGKSITFFTPEEKESAADFVDLLKGRPGQKIPPELLQLVVSKKDIEAAVEKREAKRARRKMSKAKRDGDWTCRNCGANVFATKTKCFKCGEERRRTTKEE